MESEIEQGKWSRFFSRVFGRKRMNDGDRARSFTSEYTQSGETVNSETAMRVDAVFACASLIAQSIGHLPIHIYDRSSKQIKSDHKLYSLLHDEPNSVASAADFWEGAVLNMMLHGNAVIKILRYQGEVQSLQLLDPKDVEFERVGNRLVYTHKNEVVSSDDIMHIKALTQDGYIGMSPIQYGSQVIGDALASNRTASGEFKSGSKTGGYVKVPSVMNDQQRERLRTEFDSFSREENRGRHMILELGMDYEPRGAISPVDLQLLESRKYSVEQICRFFRVPPTMIGHSDVSSSWASSQEALNGQFLRYTLAPIMRKIEASIKKSLMSDEEAFAKFNPEALMRIDSKARADFYSVMKDKGLMTANEIREKEDLPPIEGGDEIMVQMQMIPISMAGKHLEKDGSSKAMLSVEAVQKAYLGVDKVITSDEARQLINEATGSTLKIPGPAFEEEQKQGDNNET